MNREQLEYYDFLTACVQSGDLLQIYHAFRGRLSGYTGPKPAEDEDSVVDVLMAVYEDTLADSEAASRANRAKVRDAAVTLYRDLLDEYFDHPITEEATIRLYNAGSLVAYCDIHQDTRLTQIVVDAVERFRVRADLVVRTLHPIWGVLDTIGIEMLGSDFSKTFTAIKTKLGDLDTERLRIRTVRNLHDALAASFQEVRGCSDGDSGA